MVGKQGSHDRFDALSQAGGERSWGYSTHDHLHEKLHEHQIEHEHIDNVSYYSRASLRDMNYMVPPALLNTTSQPYLNMDQVGFSTEVQNIKEYENEQSTNFLRSQIDVKSQGQSTAGFTAT